MVESIKNIANRAELLKSRDRDIDSKAASSKAAAASAVSKDTVEIGSAVAAQKVAQLADNPPVNLEAVNRIKDAIASGKYPIDLDQISDALMDAYRELKS